MMRKALKGSLAAAAGIAIGLGAGGTAMAQDDEIPPATGQVDSEPGIQFNEIPEGHSQFVTAQMLSLSINGGDDRTVYCIQIDVGLEGQLDHQERAWGDIDVEDLPLVLGVLVNGYDGSNAGHLIDASGAGDHTEDPYGEFNADQVAYAATQAAIWSLTDGYDIGEGDVSVGNEAVDTSITLIRDYLLDNSEPIDEPPMVPEVEVDNSEAELDGSVVGPFTINTNYGSIAFQQPEGATVVDEDGEEVGEFTDGQQVWIDFGDNEPSDLTINTESVTIVTPAGRVFVPVDADSSEVAGQNLILAEEHSEEVSVEAPFELTLEDVPSEETPAQPQLPETGSDLALIGGIGGAVLVAGVLAMVMMRRRRASAGGDWGDAA
ncbi:Cys-Gln thioester bond-forming surface protein [Glycomyces salinus]|uniref:Cys-Gln thioester bond-forming surface protein n=1 Tax=Glycomyces salinus TaxID=980294 RepID=UPI0018EBE9BA|nr:Cys-Gln thioester bond-forming surface protein [Glycomyces salinus]